MKRCGGMVLGVAIMLGLTVAAAGVTLCEYRSPMTSLADAGMSFSYRYYDDASTSAVDVNSGRIDLTYDQVFDSPDFGYSLGGTASLGVEQFVPSDWLGQASGTARWYLWEEEAVFVFGGVETSVATSQPQPGVEVRVGVGLGRFTDVTPLAKAINIEEALLEDSAIFDGLPDDVLLSIASTIDRIDEYEEVKDLVTDVESLIEAVAGVELDARALLTVEDIIVSESEKRKCGWAVQAGIGYELIDPYGGAQNVVVAGSANAAFTTTPDDQLLFNASFSGPFDILDENTLAVRFSYESEVSEDSTLVLDYVLQRVKPAGQPVTSSHVASLSIQFDIQGVDMGLEVALGKETGDPGWSIDVSLNAAMDLL